MGNWTVIGELGAGKTILSVGRIRDFLTAGLPVATNLDIYLNKLLPYWSTQTYTRLSDYPKLPELQCLGIASQSKNEKTFGLLALDELSMWLNSHQWNKDGRDEFIVFQRHIRKRHWHTLFIAQDIESIDKQARNALVERVVRAGRLDRMKIPLFGSILRVFGFSGNLPQVHIGEVHYGKDPKSKVQERWTYYGSDLYQAYNTDQHFYESTRLDTWCSYGPNASRAFEVEIDGSFCVLSNFYVYGRFLTIFDKARKYVTLSILILSLFFFVIYCFYYYTTKPVKLMCSRPDSFIIYGSQASISVDGVVTSWPLQGSKVYTKSGCYILEVQK